jgi:hypothetical protein
MMNNLAFNAEQSWQPFNEPHTTETEQVEHRFLLKWATVINISNPKHEIF